MRNLSVLLLAGLFPLLSGCTAYLNHDKQTIADSLNIMKMGLTDEQNDHIVKLTKEPRTFKVEAKGAKEAWERAVYWVSTFSSMRIAQQNDFSIETFAPRDYYAEFGYSVSKQPLPGGAVEISVSCRGGQWSESDPGLTQVVEQRSKLNGFILAHYIRTGEMRKELIAQ